MIGKLCCCFHLEAYLHRVKITMYHISTKISSESINIRYLITVIIILFVLDSELLKNKDAGY